jgi:hypothetical protein
VTEQTSLQQKPPEKTPPEQTPALTPAHLPTLERLVARGFAIAAFPLYASAIGVRRGDFAILLAPLQGGAFRALGSACYLIDGNLSVRLTRNGRPMFVWKKREVEASPELLAGLGGFAAEVAELLLAVV